MTEELPPRNARQVLTDRHFGPYFAGNSLSSVGTWFQNLAASLLVYELTRSTLLVGVVNFAQYFSSLVLAPVAGGAADRFDRRRLLIATQLFAAVVSAVLAMVTLSGAVTAPFVIVVAALLGVSLAFMAPAMLSLVPLLVPRADLQTAVSLNSMSFNLARAVGPVIAAVVIDRYGYGPAFSINAVSFAAYATILMSIRSRQQVRTVRTRPRLRDSLTVVRGNPVLIPLLVVVAASSIASDPVYTLAPELAIDVFDGTEQTAGLLVGAFGVGAVLTALFVVERLRRRQFVLGATLSTLAAGMALVGLAPTLPVALAGMAIAGAGFLATLTRATTRIQLEVPDELLGRVMAIWTLCFIGTRPVSALVDGFLADVASPRVAAVCFAAPPLVVGLWLVRTVRPRLTYSSGGARPVDR